MSNIPTVPNSGSFLNLREASDTPNIFGYSPPLLQDGYDSSSMDSSSSISSGVSSRSSFFSRNSSRLSLDSKSSSAYMHLETQLEESRQHICLLEQQNRRLARDNDRLSAQVATLQNSFVAFTTSLGQNPINTTTTTAATGTGNSSMKEADKELDPADYQGIKFWTCSKWSHHLQAIKNVTKIDRNSSEACTSMRGSSRLAKGENVACQFIEDADGEPVDGHRAKTMRNVFSSYLHQLNQGDVKLPPTWSQVALDIKEGFYHAIRSNHVEFRYCADNWKAEYLATHNYSQWYKYHVLLIRGQKRDRSVAMDDDECVKPSSSRTKKLKAERTLSPLSEDMELDYVDLEPSVPSAMNPIHERNPVDITEPAHTSSDPILPLLSKPDDTISTIPDPVIDPILLATEPVTPTDSDLSPVPSPPVIDPILLATEPHTTSIGVSPAGVSIHNVPQVKNPLFKPTARPVAGVSGTFWQVSASSSTSTTSPTSTAPSLNIPTTMSNNTTATKPKPKPRPIKATQPKAPAVPKELNAPSKVKPMRIQKTINARNLCAAAWKAAGNLRGTAKEFKGYWERLPAAEKAVFEGQARTLLATMSVTTTSGTQGNGEEDFAASDGDE
ncbi:hypothetical protein EV702DRAFT_1202007 [Suillus placidus]|uniref:Uncharacterized protein n=1 Tax=Suillus placidus TaxID=48579 RepID=A0A9P6ZLN8_9AGAM|nr:hypothetical protein EV702DRAFT_1202007 [Suillus placidus]